MIRVTRNLSVAALTTLVALSGCAKNAPLSTTRIQARLDRAAQAAAGPGAVSSPETRDTVRDVNAGKIQVTGQARVGLLYYVDRPAHHQAVLDWLSANGATLMYDNARFGYLDAELDWKNLGVLIATDGNLGLDETSVLKLELDSFDVTGAAGSAQARAAQVAAARAREATLAPDAPSGAATGGGPADANSSFFGPVHSAGYGANVDGFRKAVAAENGLSVDDVAGQGTLVAVFDGGIDLSRTDVFQNRIRDFVIGDDRQWKPADTTLAQFMRAESIGAAPRGLEDLVNEPSLRFTTLEESTVGADLNGNGTTTDSIAVAVYKNGGKFEARVRPAKGLPFGDAIEDFGQGHSDGKPHIVDLSTGKAYVRAATDPSPSALGVRITTASDGKTLVAFVGTFPGADHGISNLHMVGGDYVDASSSVRYQGVAPKTEFLAMQSWGLDGADYGQKWLPLARNIVNAAVDGADVIDLDIYTPGTRGSNDLLSRLLCRVTAGTNAVPVVAAHNYGPLPDTVQSLAQSPCVLGIGANHSVESLRVGRNQGSIDPTLLHPDRYGNPGGDANVQTANYSGRGFGMNGLLKPDVISPAYGYTAYGSSFIRFAGTSGATPTTAGMIALLKQAARMKHVELDFNQVKFLLQGSSVAPADAFPRDGYGHTDLGKAWELFKKGLNAASGQYAVPPFVLTGQQYLEFSGRPGADLIGLTLTRQAVDGSVSEPVPMKFWIEYGGDTPAASRGWLRFYDPGTGHATPTLDRDAPMHGETQSLTLSVDLPDAAWAALPPGDHVAIVKGVRADLAQADSRAVDFLQPVAIVKGDVVGDTTYAIHPLYADQYQIFPIATRPGETLMVTGQTQCLGQAMPDAVPGSAAAGIRFMADEEATYAHASFVQNSYAPLVLASEPIRITARKSVVRLNVNRYSQMNCDGAIGGTMTVRRFGFRAGDARASVTASGSGPEGKLAIAATVPLSLTGSPLSNGELGLAVSWRLKKGSVRLVASRAASGETEFTVPSGASEILVRAADETRFVGALALQDPATGKIDAETGTPDNGMQTYAGGFGMFGDLTLSAPNAGDLARYVPAAGSDGAATSAVTIDVVVDESSSVSPAISPADPIAAWSAGMTKTISLAASLPAQKPASFQSFGPEWNYRLELDYAIEEFMPNGDADTVYPPFTIWSGTAKIPVELQ